MLQVGSDFDVQNNGSYRAREVVFENHTQTLMSNDVEIGRFFSVDGIWEIFTTPAPTLHLLAVTEKIRKFFFGRSRRPRWCRIKNPGGNEFLVFPNPKNKEQGWIDSLLGMFRSLALCARPGSCTIKIMKCVDWKFLKHARQRAGASTSLSARVSRYADETVCNSTHEYVRP